MIILQDIKKKYIIIFTKKTISVRWAYFYYLKNGAYDALVKYQKIIKIQFDRIIKKWRINSGKEYSPKKLIKLAENLGQVIELIIFYNPK